MRSLRDRLDRLDQVHFVRVACGISCVASDWAIVAVGAGLRWGMEAHEPGAFFVAASSSALGMEGSGGIVMIIT